MNLNFLVEHDRHGKIPTRITVYENIDDAEERLYKLDIDQLDELNACLKAGKPVRMEYVILGGASVESIKQTHARYFWGEYEVLVPKEIRYLASWRDGLPQTVDKDAGSTETAPVATA